MTNQKLVDRIVAEFFDNKLDELQPQAKNVANLLLEANQMVEFKGRLYSFESLDTYTVRMVNTKKPLQRGLKTYSAAYDWCERALQQDKECDGCSRSDLEIVGGGGIETT